MIKHYIASVAEGKNLNQEEAARAFQIIMNGGATPAQIAGLLIGLKRNGETVAEITGAATALRAKMEEAHAPEGAIDVCGTGGDGNKNSGGTLNVSTAVALVVAACGVPVAKHGNKSVSSLSGSADILSALGVNIHTARERTEQSLREASIGFMFAPLYHKTMRYVAETRSELGIRTIFNIIGPIINPAKPKRQLLGVYDKALLEPMAQVLRNLGSEKAWVVHGADGMDELSISGTSFIAELDGGNITAFEITPEDAGIARAEPGAIAGGNPEANAHALNRLLNGQHSAYRDIVLLNAAAALVVADKASGLKQGAALAAEAIDSGKASAALTNLIRISNEE